MLFNWTMETPTAYGWFHLMWCGIMLIEIIVYGIITDKDKKHK